MTEPTEPTGPTDSGGSSAPGQSLRPTSSGFAKSASFSVGRGLLLIGVAIVLGVVLLQLVDDGSGSKQQTSATSTTTAAVAESTTTTAKNTTGTTRPLTATNQLSVLVLNGTGQTGVAKSVADKLGAAPLSYKMQTSGNADKVTGTTVYYTGDLAAEAAALATAVNASTQGVTGVAGDANVEQLPNPVPTSWTKDNLSKAQLVVVVGAR